MLLKVVSCSVARGSPGNLDPLSEEKGVIARSSTKIKFCRVVSHFLFFDTTFCHLVMRVNLCGA